MAQLEQRREVMIDWISDWTGGIIVAVIIGTVIEMILPSGNSKKYIKVVIGIYVLFTIVSPVITKFMGETIEVSDILDLDKYVEEAEEAVEVQNTIQNNNQSSIMQMYSSGIKEDMKAKIEEKGYRVNSIDIGIANDESYRITNITIDVKKNFASEEEADGDRIVGNEEINTGKAGNTNQVEPIEKVNKIEVNIAGNSEKLNQNSNESNNSDSNNSLSNGEKNELKEYISSVYEVNKNNIIIE